MAWDTSLTDETSPSTGVGTSLNAAWYDTLITGIKAYVLPLATANAAKRTIFLSGEGGHLPTTTPTGAITAVTESTTYKVNLKGTVMPASAADTFKEFGMVMPGNWNGSTVTAKPIITTASTNASNNTIKLTLQGISYSTGETIDVAWGTLQTSTITVAASIAGLITMGAATSAITIGGTTPSGGDYIVWRVGRTGDDTFTGDITLLGWMITYTTNAYSDA